MSGPQPGPLAHKGAVGRRAKSKETRATLELAIELGWTVVEVKNGWVLRAADGVHTTNLHQTSSDKNAWRSVCRTLRRYGTTKETT